jgi:ATP-dependent Lon protease
MEMADTQISEETVLEPEGLDKKITDELPGLTVRKDLVGAVKGNALVPSYVLEYLLSKYATTTDQASINTGVERVRGILAKNYVHREEANLIQSKIREQPSYQIIDKVQVQLNEKLNQYEATFSNLGISQVVVDTNTVEKNPKLLVSGIWCMCQLGYAYTDSKHSPWQLYRLLPVQMSHDDREHYLQVRKRFTTEEWINLLMQSIGFNPALFSERAKLLHLVRMIPFVERNYNLIELGPKGTGKSHIFSEFSPHGMLISGGEVTAAKLFVNNANGRIGLVGFWDTVAFDEFAGKAKKADKALVDIMKNYMANKSFSRGVDTLQGEASMVFVGNTSHNVPYMLKNSDLFEELPAQYHDSAFLDRIHHYLPGWEFDQIRFEMFTHGYGFVVDYLAEILHNLRDLDYSDRYERYFTLSPTLTTRDKDGVKKTFSGLMKLIYPDGEATLEQMEPLLRIAIEGRKRVKDQIRRFDTTMAPVDFTYTKTGSSEPITVPTLEELNYPELYGGTAAADGSDTMDGIETDIVPSDTSSSTAGSAASSTPNDSASAEPASASEPVKAQPKFTRLQYTAAKAKEGQTDYTDGRTGVTYAQLFAPYIAGATNIRIVDPYIRRPHQICNLAEFLEMVFSYTKHDQEVSVHLVTGTDDKGSVDRQIEDLDQIQKLFSSLGIVFTYEFDASIHDRKIVSDTGWRINLGRGLDIYQFYDRNQLNPLVRHQTLRAVKSFGVTYIHTKQQD